MLKNVFTRVIRRSIRAFKKPGFWVILVATIILIVSSVTSLTNPSNPSNPSNKNNIKINKLAKISSNYQTEKDKSLTQNSEEDLNNKLIANLDKESDESIKYVYDLSHTNITVGSTYEGNFTGKSVDELLVVFKLHNMPHAGGIDCSVATIYDRKTLNLITQKTFPYDECYFDVLKDQKGRGLLLFSGSTTYQGHSTSLLQVFKLDTTWQQVLPQENSIYTNDDKYKYGLLPDGIVSVLVDTFRTGESEELLGGKVKYYLKWDMDSQTFVDFVPQSYDFFTKNKAENFISSNGKYDIVPHEYGFDYESYILLYDINKNKLIKKYDILGIGLEATWSSDSKKVCISRQARIWAGISIIDVEADKIISIPEDIDIDKVFENQGVPYKPNENRPDLEYSICEWSPDSKKILISYQWTDINFMRQNGTFIYNVNNKSITDIMQNKADGEGGNMDVKKPDGFTW